MKKENIEIQIPTSARGSDGLYGRELSPIWPKPIDNAGIGA